MGDYMICESREWAVAGALDISHILYHSGILFIAEKERRLHFV